MESILNNIDIIKTQEHKDFNLKYKDIDKTNFLANNKLIVNSQKGNLLGELKKCLEEC